MTAFLESELWWLKSQLALQMLVSHRLSETAPTVYGSRMTIWTQSSRPTSLHTSLLGGQELLAQLYSAIRYQSLILFRQQNLLLLSVHQKLHLNGYRQAVA